MQLNSGHVAVVGGGLLAVALAVSLAGPAEAMLVPPAGGPVSAAAPAQPSPQTLVCGEFRVWDAHRATTSLDALMTASESVPIRHLGEDVAYLYVAVRQGDVKFTAYERRLVREDCAHVTAAAS